MNTIEIIGALLVFACGEFPDELVTRDGLPRAVVLESEGT